MKNLLLKNRKAAALFLIAAVFFGAVFGSFRSFSVLGVRVEKEYTKTDDYGQSVKMTANDLAFHASSLAAEYADEYGYGDGYAESLKEAAASLAASDSPFEAASSASDIKVLSRAIYEKLKLNGDFTGGVRTAYASVDNDISVLNKFDSYNRAAKKFNIAARTPAGRILAGSRRAAAFS